MTKRTILIILLAALVAGAALWFFSPRTGERGATIRVSGNVEVTTVQVSFRVPGRVSERLVDEGETVREGQVVARLDQEDLRHEAAARKAGADAARAALTELERGYRKEEIAQAAAVLRRLTAEADRIGADYVRQRELYRREVISRRDYEAAEAAYKGSRASVAEAGERLALLKSGPRRETIDQARARLRDAEAVLALAVTRLGYATLSSPAAGLVLSKEVEPGEEVAAGSPIVTVGMLDNVWVRAYVSETDLGRVKVGQKARVSTDSYPGRYYEGRVSFISAEAEFTPKSVQTAKERVKLVYRIKVDIPNPHRELKPGMPADVIINAGIQESESKK